MDLSTNWNENSLSILRRAEHAGRIKNVQPTMNQNWTGHENNSRNINLAE